jgi:uncharacterized protein YegL
MSTTHIYVLLDRSGSMASIAGDVIGGFNTFLKDQQINGSDARVTLVQFDSQDPQEIIASSVPITEITSLTSDTFVPRGGTPLLDATGKLIGRAKLNAQLRSDNGLEAEDIVFVTITDGHENSSREFSLRTISDLIAQCEEQGWVFVFLSAAFDAYADAAGMGVKQGNIQAFESSGDGAQLAFTSLSSNLSTLREKKRRGEFRSEEDFFAAKEAEEERRRKRGH